MLLLYKGSDMLSAFNNLRRWRISTVKEDQAHSILRKHYNRLALAVQDGFASYRTRYPHRPRHRKTTAANVVNDEIWAEVINAFDEVPGVRCIEQRYGLRLLGIIGDTGETEILLWFKKVDGVRNPRNNPTRRSRRLHAGQNLEMFENATVLVVGYRLNKDETQVNRVSITRPSTGKPEWFIDLQIPEQTGNLVKMNPKSGDSESPARRVSVQRIKQTRLVE